MARVQYLDQSDLAEPYQPLLDPDKMGELHGVLNLFRGLANNPDVLRSFVLWSNTLWSECGLSVRERELLILRLAVGLESRYEWNQHVPIALQNGIDAEEITAIAEGRVDPFDDFEIALLQYGSKFVDRSVTDATHETLGEHLSVGEIVAVAAVCSHYVATAGIVEALGIDLEDEFVGWRLEGR